MTDSAELLKIKERIAKLLAMAADQASPNEAAIAAGRARSLMDKYQVSEFDLVGKPETAFAKKPLQEAFEDQWLVYKDSLAIAVATYNDCVCRYEFGWVQKPRGAVKGKRIVMMGFESDVDLGCGMFARLEEAIIRLRKEWFIKTKTPYSHRLRRNFEDAAAYEISRRLKAMTAERDTITHVGAGTSLMVIKTAAVAEHFGETKYGTRKSTGKFDWAGAAASQAGREHGAKVEIVPLVS